MNRLSNFTIKNKIQIGVVLLSVIAVLAISVAYFSNSNKEIEQMTTLANSVQIKAHLEVVPEGYTPITTPAELEAINNDLSGKYILMNDIDMSGVTHEIIGKSSTSAFTGIFDGNNYKISNLTIESNNSYIGMFGYAKYATIKNVLLDNVNIKGNIAVGGLVGNSGGSTIINVCTTGQVSGKSEIGGIIGNNTGTITNSFSTAQVIGTDSYIGGLVGSNYSTITNSYSIGQLVGQNRGTITNSYYAIDTNNPIINKGGEGKFLSSMLKQNTYKDWEFDTVWEIQEGNTLPYLQGMSATEAIKKENYEYEDWEGIGTEESPYLIKNPEQLKSINALLSSHYQLANDIDMSGITHEIIGSTSSLAFTGTFDGNGHKISNLTLESNNQYVGLFGYTNGSIIKNIILENINVSGTNSSNSTLIGTGGLVGQNGGIITNIGITGQVKSVNQYTGGLVGKNGGTITNSFSNVMVSGKSAVGGLVGANEGEISSAYAIGEVIGNASNIGGLVGNHIKGTITDTFSTAKVTGVSYIGGLVGQNCSAITNSYAVGEVTGTTAVGGLVGAKSSTRNN